MKSFNEIRSDLTDIRYYYTQKQLFDEATKEVGVSAVVLKVKKYNSAITLAPAKLYELYVCLYVKNYTQERMAMEHCWSTVYVQKQHNKLLGFLQSQIN